MKWKMILSITMKLLTIITAIAKLFKSPVKKDREENEISQDVLGSIKDINVQVSNIKYSSDIAKDFLFVQCETLYMSNVIVIDSSESLAAHRDAIQIAPLHRSGYLAGEIKSVEIRNVTVKAQRSNLQGIFCGDGYIHNIDLRDVTIETMSHHSITLSGVRMGKINGCVTSTPILLLPIRVFGGTEDGFSIWIIDDLDLIYDDVSVDLYSKVHDIRTVERRGWNVYNVNTKEIINDVDDPNKTWQERRKIFLDEAKTRGASIKYLE